MSSSAPPGVSSARLNRLLTFIELDAGNLALRKDAIREACDTGHWDIARSLIDAGLQAHPDDAELLGFSGFAHLQACSYVDAERAFSAALVQRSDATALRYNLAFAYFMQKRYPDALEVLTAQVRQEVPLALLLRARCLHHLRRSEEAIADCRAHLAVAAEDPETNGLLALILYESGQTEPATQHADKALKQNPKQLEAMLALASMQSDAQQYDVAKASFNTLLEAHPQCGRGWLGLALIELTHLQIEAARRDIELAATHMQEHIGTWHVLAWIHIMQGDVQAAEDAFKSALALDRNFGETHGGLAVIAALQGREEDARASMKRALRLDPQCLSARCAEMALLQREGRNDEARAVLDAVLARPVARSDMQYRDLVAMRMKYLQARTVH